MEAAPLDRHLGYWLRLVSNHVSHAFARRLAERRVTVAEWAVLRSLADGPIAPGRLAARMGLTKGAISRLADRLAAKGLVARADDADDRRAQRLSLTAAGAALVPELAALADANEEAVFGAMDPDERDGLARALRGLAARHRLTSIPID